MASRKYAGENYEQREGSALKDDGGRRAGSAADERDFLERWFWRSMIDTGEAIMDGRNGRGDGAQKNRRKSYCCFGENLGRGRENRG